MRDFLKLLGALLTVIITFSISILFSFLIPLMVEGNILNMGKLNQPTFIMLWIIFSVIFNIIILILAFSLIQFSSDFVNKMKLIATLTFL
ncbi:putative neutral ceramidase superfamily lipid hydrolase [Staphylococcus hominis]